ncbi:hypothetical protein Hanom_Chr05g00411261 [Helianthus anomalus]
MAVNESVTRITSRRNVHLVILRLATDRGEPMLLKMAIGAARYDLQNVHNLFNPKFIIFCVLLL